MSVIEFLFFEKRSVAFWVNVTQVVTLIAIAMRVVQFCSTAKWLTREWRYAIAIYATFAAFVCFTLFHSRQWHF